MWGGDTLVLTKILSNDIQSLYQLMALVGATEDSLHLVRDINQGLNDSLAMAQTMRVTLPTVLYGDWKDPQQALSKLRSVYGAVPTSKEAGIQGSLDLGVAEAVSQNNAAFSQAEKFDLIGEQVKQASHTVSPGGAQKLTAESMGVMLHVMNESLRTQAVGVKLAAQRLAADNHRDKEETRSTLESAAMLDKAMKSESTSFTTPRF